MKKYTGKTVYKGIAMGPVLVMKKSNDLVKRSKITSADAEIARVAEAVEKSQGQLQKLYDKAVKEVGEASAAIFEVHQMMLDDDDYLDSIHNMIRTEMVNAEYAVAVTGDNFSEMFANMDDEYMKARSADIKDISNRLIRCLDGSQDADLTSEEPSVIVADDLTPSETVQMDKSKILAFVTVHGSTNSHTAILARMMNIPALIGVPMELEELHTGMLAVVDGFQSKVTFDPTEEEQFTAYRQVLQNMAGKKVVIRTLDIGADKQVDYFNLGNEDNPALGYRAIRICLSQPDIFKTQLRALFRAAVYGNLAVMYPMITSVEEVERIRAIVEEVCSELNGQEIPYKEPEQGIMIETPAAVMVSDDLAKVVDFFSIGTNDLTQYTLAIDRQNERLDAFYNPHHKAILRMIRMVTDNAHAAGKWVGICGELGADVELTREFLQMGIDELSVAPSMVLKVRQRVREIKVEE